VVDAASRIKPKDYVIATGQTTSVRDFVSKAFANAGVHIRFEGEGVNEVGIVDKVVLPDVKVKVGDVVVEVDKKYFRPTEVDLLLGNPPKSKKESWWSPRIYSDE
jgi:GDPmannose 4,6-dehydratase